MLPGSNPADVHMNEVRPGVVPDPAGGQRKSERLQFTGSDSRHSNVNGLAIQMQALRRHPPALAVQRGVGRNRPEAGDDMKGARSFKAQAEAVKKVQQLGGDGAHLAGTVIPQNVVDIPESTRIVSTGFAVTGFQAFAGMGVEERQMSFRRGGRFGNGRL